MTLCVYIYIYINLRGRPPILETGAELAAVSERAPFVLDVLNSNDSETAQINLEEEESLNELENVEIDDDSSKS